MTTSEAMPKARRPSAGLSKALYQGIYHGVLGALRGGFWVGSRLAPVHAATRALKMFTTPQRLRRAFALTLPGPRVLELGTAQGRLRGLHWAVLQTEGLGHVPLLKDRMTLAAVVDFVCAEEARA